MRPLPFVARQYEQAGQQRNEHELRCRPASAAFAASDRWRRQSDRQRHERQESAEAPDQEVIPRSCQTAGSGMSTSIPSRNTWAFRLYQVFAAPAKLLTK